MYKRSIKFPKDKSFFLLGPRGTGKTTWLQNTFPDAIYINLLQAKNFNKLLVNPDSLSEYIPGEFPGWIILDEVQKVPELLDTVHYLIEEKKLKFILTGSSARKLKRKGVNLLAGRALTYKMYPLTSSELGKDFSLHDALQWGTLPAVFQEKEKERFLESYVMTYLEEEVKQEGLVRNLGSFSRFLESASFSQGSTLSISEVARSCSITRRVAENYFSIANDLLIAHFLPAFTKRAKRELIRKDKFYFFDSGVYLTVKPKGPLDSPEEIDGYCLETLVLQELLAHNDYYHLGNKLYYWRSKQGHEVDFVVYGKSGITAIEVKRKGNVNQKDLKGLRMFLKDYPTAKASLFYGGNETRFIDNITIAPIQSFFSGVKEYL